MRQLLRSLLPPLLSAFDFTAPPGAGAPIGTGAATLAAADGLFCPGQRNAGAFGEESARRIVETGAAYGDLRDHLPHAILQAGVPCVPSTGNAAADGLADLPGPERDEPAGDGAAPQVSCGLSTRRDTHTRATTPAPSCA